MNLEPQEHSSAFYTNAAKGGAPVATTKADSYRPHYEIKMASCYSLKKFQNKNNILSLH